MKGRISAMTEYERLKDIINEIDDLLDRSIKSSDPDFRAWKTKTERFLIKAYGEDSYEYKELKNTQFTSLNWNDEDAERNAIKRCAEGLKTCKAIFENYLEDFLEENKCSVDNGTNDLDCKKIFIVHGHDAAMKEAVARIVEKQNIEAIILSEKANQGKTIIEKFEQYADVGGAICLFTADDMGKAKDTTKDALRARQNVVFETGFFMGRLSRNRVIILADNNIEMPSDLSGVVYTDTSDWQVTLLKEMKQIGYAIDFNKLMS